MAGASPPPAGIASHKPPAPPARSDRFLRGNPFARNPSAHHALRPVMPWRRPRRNHAASAGSSSPSFPQSPHGFFLPLLWRHLVPPPLFPERRHENGNDRRHRKKEQRHIPAWIVHPVVPEFGVNQIVVDDRPEPEWGKNPEGDEEPGTPAHTLHGLTYRFLALPADEQFTGIVVGFHRIAHLHNQWIKRAVISRLLAPQLVHRLQEMDNLVKARMGSLKCAGLRLRHGNPLPAESAARIHDCEAGSGGSVRRAFFMRWSVAFSLEAFQEGETERNCEPEPRHCVDLQKW